MSDVIKFPTINNSPNDVSQAGHVRSPVEALEYLLDGIRSGATVPDSLIISWTNLNEDESSHFCYLIGGDLPLTGAVGLLEITKAAMLE